MIRLVTHNLLPVGSRLRSCPKKVALNFSSAEPARHPPVEVRCYAPARLLEESVVDEPAAASALLRQDLDPQISKESANRQS